MLAACLLACAASACGDLRDFRGTYRAEIVEGNFVRSCFRSGTRATLRFDPDQAVVGRDAGASTPNTLTIDDGTFQDTPLEPIRSLPHDPLSQLDFPGPQRLRSYMLLARPSTGPLAGRDALVVISLLASEGLEVRVIARSADGAAGCPDEPEGAAPDPGARREYFGLFRMNR